ncbi:hypothetical protein D3C87_520250 [compost metagenome]
MTIASFYSIVIHPPDEVIEQVRELKVKLYKESGESFSSRKSIAHITVQEFQATEDQLNKIILKLIKITREQEIFKAVFDKVVYSQETALFIPDNNCRDNFKKLLERIRLEIKGGIKSRAHISIGRKLSLEQLEISRKIFSDEVLEFHSNKIALRKFNDKIGQFEILRIFPFLGEASSEEQLIFQF